MSHPFEALQPEAVLQAVESLGLWSDARVFALNSYENRVYQVGIEDGEPLIAKFYRPNRWSEAALREEHAFSFALQAQEVPVVAPLQINGESLFYFEGFHFALFPRRGGHAPEPGDLDQLYRLGQLLGRLHSVGSLSPFQHREVLSPATLGERSVNFLLASEHLPQRLRERYQHITTELLQELRARFAEVAANSVRLHGDCHLGNLILRDEILHVVDLDDCRQGPAVQDMWMLLCGTRMEQQAQVSELIEGYEEFRDFDRRELALIEPLRTLRLMYYSAWLAQRWDDPAFPKAFPWFGKESYWDEHVKALEEQARVLNEPALAVY